MSTRSSSVNGTKTALSRSTKHAVIIAGLGGGGVLMAGQLLAQAGISQYRNVVYFPSYATSMRGGAVECTVILSHRRIGSPVLTQAEALVIMDVSQLQYFENRLQPGGLLILESSRLESGQGVKRQDVRVINVPALKMATDLGDTRATNLILLGAYIRATKALSPQYIEAELERRLLGRGEEALLSLNKKAFRAGLEIGDGQ
jgi:2-oxoglutarate ferredoxin oxidoreductase subunit gamma